MWLEIARGVVVVVGRSHSSAEVEIGCRRLVLDSFVVLVKVGISAEGCLTGNSAEGRYFGFGCSCNCSGMVKDSRASESLGIVVVLIAVRVGHYSGAVVCFDRRVEVHCCRLEGSKAILGGVDWGLAAIVVAAGI